MSIDRYLDRVYRPKQYNCLDLAAEVWLDLTGRDLHEAFQGLIDTSLSERAISRHSHTSFKILDKPTDLCLVLFQRYRRVPHIGVWIKGSVLHIQELHGVQYMPLHIVRMGFDKVRFFVPREIS